MLVEDLNSPVKGLAVNSRMALLCWFTANTLECARLDGSGRQHVKAVSTTTRAVTTRRVRAGSASADSSSRTSDKGRAEGDKGRAEGDNGRAEADNGIAAIGLDWSLESQQELRRVSDADRGWLYYAHRMTDSGVGNADYFVTCVACDLSSAGVQCRSTQTTVFLKYFRYANLSFLSSFELMSGFKLPYSF